METMTVSFTWENDHNSYSRDMTMEWRFYDDVWKIDTYEYISNITTELTSETSEELSDERMLDDLYQRSIERMWGEIYLTPDMCESYTFGDYEFFHDGSCQRELEMELKGDDIFTVHVSAIFAYDYDEEFGWEQKGNILVRINGVEQNLVGNYSGTVYNEDGEQYATIYYYILEADDDGNFSGYIKWVPDGEDVDSVEEIGLTGTYNIDLLSLVVEYDEEIDILGYNKISEEYIYYNFETQHLFFL